MERKNIHSTSINPLQDVLNIKKSIERCKFGEETERNRIRVVL